MKSKNTQSKSITAKQTDEKSVIDTAKDRSTFKSTVGTADEKLALYILRELATLVESPSDKDVTESIGLALSLQHSIQPKDELEALLASQMAGAHHLAMRFMKRASDDQSTEVLNANVERATKMMRTFTAQMEALNRYRGKGQQKVTVEHVTVNQGGQAVIGVIEKAGGGGGDEQK